MNYKDVDIRKFGLPTKADLDQIYERDSDILEEEIEVIKAKRPNYYHKLIDFYIIYKWINQYVVSEKDKGLKIIDIARKCKKEGRPLKVLKYTRQSALQMLWKEYLFIEELLVRPKEDINSVIDNEYDRIKWEIKYSKLFKSNPWEWEQVHLTNKHNDCRALKEVFFNILPLNIKKSDNEEFLRQ